MYSQVISTAIYGIEAKKITIEADVSNGMPCFDMIGYLSSEVREAQERVRTSIKNAGLNLPVKRLTVNLAPADLRKEGSGFDLAIAVAVLIAAEQVSGERAKGILFAGELGLDGRVEPVRGMIEMVSGAARFGCHSCIIPAANLREGSVIEAVQVYGAETLADVIAFLREGKPLLRREDLPGLAEEEMQKSELDFSQISGQAALKRAAEVAAAGGHNLLIVGPPGAGKTMTAQRFPTILPAATREEALEITRIHSIAGTLPDRGTLLQTHPFRAPHHTITAAGMAGGGHNPRPGEISLAHRGVLYLDELPEFKTQTLEILRQPMEDQQIVIARNFGHYTFPADFQLIASMNPCKCGYYPDRTRCRCTPFDVKRYLSHISQPLLDRIDICVEAEEMTFEEIAGRGKGADRQSGRREAPESSAVIRRRVTRARQIQQRRFAGKTFHCNARMGAGDVEAFCPLQEEERCLMEKIYQKMQLSVRGYMKMLKVARTIADLRQSPAICGEDIREAAAYRMIDQKYWGGR